MRRAARGCCAIVVLLIACGEPEDGGVEDASLPDAGVDSGPVAPPGDAGVDAHVDLDAGHTDGGPGEEPIDSGVIDAAPSETVRVRVVAANLTSGSSQSYDPGHGIRILDALDPDIVLVQEMNYGSGTPAAIRELTDRATSPEFHVYREPTSGLPNGILSRWPILASGVWDDPQVDNRELVWARIDVPGAIDLWAVSVHLLTRNSTVRQAEAAALVEYVRANVPEGDYLVIGGDLNTSDVWEPALTTLGAVVERDVTPVDQNGVSGTNASRASPYDWVLPDPDLAARHVPVVLGSQTFPTGLVFDTRVYSPLDEVPPAMAEDSAAPSMQHMAVVRDFALPGS